MEDILLSATYWAMQATQKVPEKLFTTDDLTDKEF
jgi:hypothetical protein